MTATEQAVYKGMDGAGYDSTDIRVLKGIIADIIKQHGNIASAEIDPDAVRLTFKSRYRLVFNQG